MKTARAALLKFPRFLPVMLAAWWCVSCGGGPNSGTSAPSSTPQTIDQPSPPPPPPPPLSPAQQTAEQNPACQLIQPFYFEIGDAGGVITNASVGAGAPTATTPMMIASGTKWLFGAYVAEVRSGVLSPADLLETHMISGYVGMGFMDQCDPLSTVSSCFNTPPNNTFTLTSLGRFDYGGGHFQKWGVDNGLGDMGIVALTAEFQRTLEPGVAFINPTLAGGAFMSASEYAAFLRKILRGELKIAALLGTNPVCTLPGVCPTADFSPIQLAWHYSVGHWVEDDPATPGDGSFSSPGALGFYPWIDSTKTYYGIVARQSASGNPVADSIECGRLIRKAFITGVPQ